VSFEQKSFQKAEPQPRNPLRLKETLFQTLGLAVSGLALRNKSSLRYRLLGCAVLLVIAVFFIPATFCNRPDFGLDPSWRLLLNKAFSESWQFGTQLVWTYGPLGILESRLPYGVNRVIYASYDFFVLLIFLWLTLDVIKLQLDTKLVLGSIVVLGCIKDLISGLPSSALYCLAIFLVVRNLSHPGFFTSAALVLVSTVMFFFKLNFGLVGILFSCIVLVCQTLERNKHAYLWLAILMSELLAASLVAAHLHTNPIQYVTAGLALIRQYNDGMSAGPGRGGLPHIAVCFLFTAYLAMTAASLRKCVRRDFVYLLISAAAVFVLFKTAIVRSDYWHHNRCFLLGFPLLSLIFFTHGPETMRRLWRPLFLGSATYAAMLLLAEYGDCLIYMKREHVNSFFPIDFVRGFANYNSSREWNSYVDFARNDSPERCVPENVRTLIGRAAVDVFPYEATLPLASGLNYQSRPIPQSYAALGPRLEERNQAFFESAQAPGFLLYVLGQKLGSIDERYALWDEPNVKRLIRNKYECRLVFTNLLGSTLDPPITLTPVLLLERKTSSDTSAPISLTTQTETASHDFHVPDHEGELYAKIVIRKTLPGRLLSLFYRGGRAWARFELEDGTTRRLRIVPANLENGVLVNYFEDEKTPDGVRNYFCNHSRGNPRCVKLRIEFDHSWEYKSRFEVSYFYLSSPTP
jgi:hypothetical protein